MSAAGGEARAAAATLHAADKSVAAAEAKSAAPLDVSASVGHDQDHLFRHIPDANGTAAAAGDECSHGVQDAAAAESDAAAASPPAAAPETESAPSPPLDPVAQLVLAKKRKFHSGRVLELKNLPDGCTEQVGKTRKELGNPWDKN